VSGRVGQRDPARDDHGVGGRIDRHSAAVCQRAAHEQFGDPVVDLALDQPAQRPRTVLGLVAVIDQPVDRGIRDLDRDLSPVQPTLGRTARSRRCG
jgi:hypothetical protein